MLNENVTYATMTNNQTDNTDVDKSSTSFGKRLTNLVPYLYVEQEEVQLTLKVHKESQTRLVT